MAEKYCKTVKRLVGDKESALKDVMDTITKESGPFQRKLQQVCIFISMYMCKINDNFTNHCYTVMA